MMKIIDPHLHLFNLELGDYHWLQSGNAPFWPDKSKICKSYAQSDLQLSSPLSLAGFVHIEAGFDNQQPWREIQWLESHCTLPFKSIAAIDLLSSTKKFEQAINQLKQYNSVVGVRDILDENAISYLSNKQVQNNLALLADEQLIFELQMPLSNIESVNLLIYILQKSPQLSVVINHGGSPSIQNKNSAEHHQWLQGIQALSQFPNCSIKCSGFEMAARNYSPKWQLTIIKQCITTFGINRVMLASNFPLCTFTTNYNEYWLDLFSLNTQEKLFYENAFKIYNFE